MVSGLEGVVSVVLRVGRAGLIAEGEGVVVVVVMGCGIGLEAVEREERRGC
jgi:hypothetical protein